MYLVIFYQDMNRSTCEWSFFLSGQKHYIQMQDVLYCYSYILAIIYPPSYVKFQMYFTILKDPHIKTVLQFGFSRFENFIS